MYLSIILKCIALFLLFSSSAFATTGQIPLTTEATPTTTSTPAPPTITPSSSSSLPTVSYTTTLLLPDLNLRITAEQLDDPELENIISALLPKEMFTLLVSATAKTVSPSPAPFKNHGGDRGGDEDGMRGGQGEEEVLSSVQEILVAGAEGHAAGSTSVAMRGEGWNGVMAAETRVEVMEGRVGL